MVRIVGMTRVVLSSRAHEHWHLNYTHSSQEAVIFQKCGSLQLGKSGRCRMDGPIALGSRPNLS